MNEEKNEAGKSTPFWVVIVILAIFVLGLLLVLFNVYESLKHGCLFLFSAFCIIGGVGGFVYGFTLLRRKRLIENVPTSTVRGLAMGLVELVGKAEKTKIFTSPLTQTECVYYRYVVDHIERKREWVVIAEGISGDCPFWLDDGTGKIMVFPQGAELMMPVDYIFQAGSGETLPKNLVDYMRGDDRYKYEHFRDKYGRNTLEIHCVRFREWFLVPHETVYVLGTAEKYGDPSSHDKKKLPQVLEELKGDPQDNSLDVVIGKGDAGQAFIISDESQVQLGMELGRKAFWYMVGGAVIGSVSLGYFIDCWAAKF